MRTYLKHVPALVWLVRAVRQLPGAAPARRMYAELFTRRIFTTIYRENQWGDASSRSGSGSTMTATARLRSELPALLRDHGVQTMLDVPCGDFHWMSSVDLGTIRYIGADIVPELIAKNRERWGGANRQFIVLDASRDEIPRVDLILCRDLFIHLSYARIRRVLDAFRASGATWLAASTYAECPVNEDTRTGGYHEINLQAAPFHFEAPTALLCEEPGLGAASKYLGLWRLRRSDGR